MKIKKAAVHVGAYKEFSQIMVYMVQQPHHAFLDRVCCTGRAPVPNVGKTAARPMRVRPRTRVTPPGSACARQQRKRSLEER